MALADTARLAVRIDLEGNATAGIAKLNKQVRLLGSSTGRIGKGFGQVGAGIARAGLVVGGAAIAGLAGAAKAAIDFEDAFAGVRKTVDEKELTAVGLTFETLAKQFRDLATEIPVAATELAAIGETAGALGIKASDIVGFTEVVAKLAVTTDLTSEAAAEALGKVGTILNFTGQDFEDFADILVNLGNKGASVESEIIEITKRFAASGKQAGLSVSQILAFSSAIASAGAEPEAAGSSLSRLFGNLITDTANATKKGKAFAKITGKSFKDFSTLVRKDTVGAMLLFLRRLKDLDKFKQQQALKAVGITNVRDRNAILLLAETYDTNLVPALKNAQNASGALAVEAQKRFGTLRNTLTLFSNNIKEAAITVGEGFTPALGRATDKLIAFLKQDATKSELKKLGEDIGKAIDGIDWETVLRGAKEFVGVMKGALSFALLIANAINALPGPLKEAGAGFLALNKLSGGLVGAGVGNILGGLGETAARAGGSRLPVIGKLFAQPVFVTNWPLGFGLGGTAGAGAGAAGATGAAAIGLGPIIGAAVGVAVAQKLSLDAFTTALRNAGVKSNFQAPSAGVTSIVPSLQNIAEAIRVAGEVAKPQERGLEGMRVAAEAEAATRTAGANIEAALHASGERTTTSIAHTTSEISAAKERIAAEQVETARETARGSALISNTTRNAANSNAAIISGAMHAAAAAIVAAIWAAQPVVNVTNVTKSTTIQNRYGPDNGSYGTPEHGIGGH